MAARVRGPKIPSTGPGNNPDDAMPPGPSVGLRQTSCLRPANRVVAAKAMHVSGTDGRTPGRRFAVATAPSRYGSVTIIQGATSRDLIRVYGSMPPQIRMPAVSRPQAAVPLSALGERLRHVEYPATTAVWAPGASALVPYGSCKRHATRRTAGARYDGHTWRRQLRTQISIRASHWESWVFSLLARAPRRRSGAGEGPP